MPIFFKSTYRRSLYFVRFTVVFIFITTTTILRAQLGPACINLSANRIYFSKDSSSMMNFYKKIDELKSGKRKRVNIVHFGGSHIQAGLLTEVLMDSFQTYNKYTGGGTFIFPFAMLKTNSPHFFKSFTTGNWKRCRAALTKEMCEGIGMAGLAGITNDSASTFGFKLLANKHHQTFNSVKVYHNFNPSFELALENKTLPFERKDHKKNGYSEFTFEGYIDSLSFVLLKKDTIHKDFMLRGFSIENDNPGFYYAALGANGARSNTFLGCTEMVNELKSIPPDLVILSLGVNDSQGNGFSKQGFIAKYDSMITEVRKASPKCAILITTTTDNYIKRKTANKRSIIAQEAAFDLMKKHKIAVYDMFAVMGGYKSIYKWHKVGFANKDRVHLVSKGYVLIANLMMDAIKKSYLQSSSKED